MDRIRRIIDGVLRNPGSDRYIVPYLAFWCRLLLRRHQPLVIGITGTVGKTTTTQMLASVLGQEASRSFTGRVASTLSNQNGDRGLPASVIGVSVGGNSIAFAFMLASLPFRVFCQLLSSNFPKVFVLEFGTYDRGHLHELAKLAPPQIAVVTTIGPGHLERLGTMEGVYQEKRAVVQAVPASGLVVLGSGHDFVNQLSADSKAPIVCVDGTGLELAANITRAVCEYLGLPDKIVREGIDSYEPPAGRLTKFEVSGVSIIDDSYNANPLSMKLGLDTLSGFNDGDKRGVALLGSMAELGELSGVYHAEVGAYARRKVDLLVGVGDEARGYSPDHWFPTSAECAAAVAGMVTKGDIVLVKGSASTKMRIVVDALRDHFSAE